MTRGRVAIIGAGFSGAVLAAHLAGRGRAAPDILLIERRRRFGPGLAYGTNDPAHLLNVRAANLSAFSDQPDHFVRWCARQGARFASPTRFAPRMQYGRYIENVLHRSSRWFGPKLARIRGAVTACSPEGQGWRLTLEDGRVLRADAVVLALGNPPPTPPPFFKSADVPLIDPWDSKALKRIPSGDVLLLGAGLTSVDVALTLVRLRRKGAIHALSRRGQLPRAHLESAAAPAPHAMDLPLPLSAALFAFRKEVEAAAGRGEPWQHVLDRLRARTPELWQRLPSESQRRFLRHVRPWWDAHRHRMAPDIAAQIAALQAEGRLRVWAGEVAAAERKGRTIHLHHRQRGSLVRHRFDVAGVVNCTGASMELAASADPLLQQLFNDGLVRAHPSGLGLDVDVDGRAVAASGATQPNLYALGPVTQGTFWEATAVPEIRVRAAALASMLAPD